MKKTLTLFTLFAAMLIAFSCKKDNRPYKLTVQVYINDSLVVQNALVRVYAPVENSFIDYYSYTNGNGESEFEFPNKAILEIEAGKSGYKGCNYVELERGTRNVRVDMFYYTDPKTGCK